MFISVLPVSYKTKLAAKIQMSAVSTATAEDYICSIVILSAEKQKQRKTHGQEIKI